MVLTLLQTAKSEGGLGKYDVVKYLDGHPSEAAQIALALGAIESARKLRPEGLTVAMREVVPRAAVVVGSRAGRRRAWGHHGEEVKG